MRNQAKRKESKQSISLVSQPWYSCGVFSFTGPRGQMFLCFHAANIASETKWTKQTREWHVYMSVLSLHVYLQDKLLNCDLEIIEMYK